MCAASQPARASQTDRHRGQHETRGRSTIKKNRGRQCSHPPIAPAAHCTHAPATAAYALARRGVENLEFAHRRPGGRSGFLSQNRRTLRPEKCSVRHAKLFSQKYRPPAKIRLSQPPPYWACSAGNRYCLQTWCCWTTGPYGRSLCTDRKSVPRHTLRRTVPRTQILEIARVPYGLTVRYCRSTTDWFRLPVLIRITLHNFVFG
eukprot:COSAG02_NODE_3678_length_6391_cov_3.177845_2_plen_204_part_00